MPTVSFIVVHRQGHDTPCLVPSTPFDEGIVRRQRWETGEVVCSEFRKPRVGWHHRQIFGMLRFVFEAQERFGNPEALRRHLALQTSFVIEDIDRATGELVRIPRSWAYNDMDELEFTQLHAELVPVILREFFPSCTPAWLKESVDAQAFLDGVMSYSLGERQ